MQKKLRAGWTTFFTLEGHVWLGDIIECRAVDELAGVMASEGVEQAAKEVLQVMQNGSHIQELEGKQGMN